MIVWSRAGNLTHAVSELGLTTVEQQRPTGTSTTMSSSTSSSDSLGFAGIAPLTVPELWSVIG